MSSSLDYSGQDLTGANFSFRDLTGANFSNANLTRAFFINSTLDDANFNNAILTDANFNTAKTLNVKFTNATLINVIFNYLNLTGSNFSNSNLENAKFEHGNLTNVNFTGAKLINVSLVDTMLTNVNFTNAKVYYAKLSFHLSRYSRKQSEGSYDNTGVETTTLPRRYFWIRSLNNHLKFHLGGPNIDMSDYEPVFRDSTTYLKNRNISGSNLTNVSLLNANLSGANMSNTNLTNVTMYGANLTNTDLRNAHFMDTNVRYIRGSGDAKILETYRWHVVNERGNLLGANLDLRNYNLEGMNLTNINLSNVKLMGANLIGANITGSNLSGALFHDSTLINCRILNSNLTNTNFGNSNLTNADITNSIITSLNLTNANMTNMRISNITEYDSVTLPTTEYLWHTTSSGSVNLIGPKVNMTNYNLVEVDLSGVNLSGANLTNVDMTGANLTNVNLENVTLGHTRISNIIHYDGLIIPSDDYKIYERDGMCCLVGHHLDMRDYNLREFDVSGMNLRNTILDNINLTDVNMSFVDLRQSSLKNAILNNTNFDCANLSDLDFYNVHFENSHTQRVLFNNIPTYVAPTLSRFVPIEETVNTVCDFLYLASYMNSSEIDEMKTILYDLFEKYKFNFHGIRNVDSYLALKFVQIINAIESNDDFINTNTLQYDAFKKYTIRHKVHTLLLQIKYHKTTFVVSKDDPNFLEIERLLHEIHNNIPVDDSHSEIHIHFAVGKNAFINMNEFSNNSVVYIDKIPYAVLHFKNHPYPVKSVQYVVKYNKDTHEYEKYYIDLSTNKRYNPDDTLSFGIYTIRFDSIGSTIMKVSKTSKKIDACSRVGSKLSGSRIVKRRC